MVADVLADFRILSELAVILPVAGVTEAVRASVDAGVEVFVGLAVLFVLPLIKMFVSITHFDPPHTTPAATMVFALCSILPR
jgi:hypothetical protein